MPSFKNIYQTGPNAVTTPVPTVPNEREKEYKHNIVRSKDESFGAIISHIEGSTWTVDYYSQMLGSNQEPMPYDINQSTLNQQYHLIHNLEMKLQNQDMSTEDKTNRIAINGTAVIFAGLIPNHGDVIIADIGQGLAGRMNVTLVTKKSYMNDTVYEIDFELIEYINTQNKAEHINSFVVKTSVYNRDLIAAGGNPLLLKEEYDDYLSAEDVVAELLDTYLKEFHSNELGTIEVPGYGANKTYDPYVIEALFEVIDYKDHPLIAKIKRLNVNEIKEAYSFSIWPVLIDPSINKLRNTWRRAGPVKFNEFHVNPYMYSFRYSGFNQCISPVEDLQNVDYYNGWAQQSKVGNRVSNRLYSYITTNFGTAIGNKLLEAVQDQNQVCCHHLVHYHEANPSALPYDSRTWLDTVHLWVRATGHYKACAFCGGCDVCCDGTTACDGTGHGGRGEEDELDYVLSKHFFDNKALDDPFHSIVRRHVAGENIDLRDLLNLVEKRHDLTPKQRFYRMAVVLIIIKATLRGM